MKTRICFLILFGAVILWSGCNELKDGLPPPVSSGAQVHLDSWVDTSSTNFHGTALTSGASNVSSCLKCHGQDYNGGTSNVSCITCHQTSGANIHGRGFETKTSPNFHGKVIANANWDMRPCQTCHGMTYAGGKVPVSCRTCHNQGGGPENCATCHGSTNPAPPRALNDSTSRTYRGVGAHQKHLALTISATMYCNDCHVVPGETYSAGHLDGALGAEVIMDDPLVKTRTNKPGTPNYTPSLPLFTPNPAYNATEIKCANTYCHGSFKNGNTDFAPKWTDPPATVAQLCGTCHGDVTKSNILERALPKTSARGGSHPTIPTGWTCANCHGDVVNASTQIVNASKHINGKLNIGPLEMDY